MLEQKVISRQLAVKEDLLLGLGKSKQTRAGMEVEVSKLSVADLQGAIAVNTYSELLALKLEDLETKIAIVADQSTIYRYNEDTEKWENYIAEILENRFEEEEDKTDTKLEQKLDIDALNSNLTLYPVDEMSDYDPTCYLSVNNTLDERYPQEQVIVETPEIEVTDTVIGFFLSDEGVLRGNITNINVTIAGSVRIKSGANVQMWFEIYHYDEAADEYRLICISDRTQQISEDYWVAINASGLTDNFYFNQKDRVKMIFYGRKLGIGDDPIVEMIIGGHQPIRALFPVPINAVPTGEYASEEETKAGQVDNKAVTPAGISSLIVQETGNDTELLMSQKSVTNVINPIGSIFAFAGTGIPIGNVLPCEGGAVSRSAYAELFAAIGTLYGAGNGSTTFNLPDLRGRFIRGFGGNSAAIGTAQGDAIRNITGELFISSTSGKDQFLSDTNVSSSGAMTITRTRSGINGLGNSSSTGVYPRGFDFNASRQVPTSTENRPINYAMKFFIRY